MPAAAGIGISPILLEIGPRNRVATLTFSNGDDRAAKVVAEVKTRAQPDGRDEVLSDTDDLLVNPPIALVPAGKSQIFRVALRRPLPPGPERAYRLVITDVTPVTPDSSGTSSVAIRLSHQVPLYVTTSPGGSPSLTIAPCAAATGATLCASVGNNGQAHAQVLSVTFHGDGWSEVSGRRGALLAGGVVRFSLPRPTSLKGGVHYAVTVALDGQQAPASADLVADRP